MMGNWAIGCRVCSLLNSMVSGEVEKKGGDLVDFTRGEFLACGAEGRARVVRQGHVVGLGVNSAIDHRRKGCSEDAAASEVPCRLGVHNEQKSAVVNDRPRPHSHRKAKHASRGAARLPKKRRVAGKCRYLLARRSACTVSCHRSVNRPKG